MTLSKSVLNLSKSNDIISTTMYDKRHTLSISNDIISTKTYDKWGDFEFDISNFLYLDGDVPGSKARPIVYMFCFVLFFVVVFFFFFFFFFS